MIEPEEIEGRLLAMRLVIAGLIASQPDQGKEAMAEGIMRMNEIFGEIPTGHPGRKMLAAMQEETQRIWTLAKE